MKFTPELRLALDTCRAHFRAGPEVPTSIDGVDWHRFGELVRFHRIQGLAWNFLSSSSLEMPAALAPALKDEAAAIAAANLHATIESDRLLKAFEAAGQPILFLKGLTLGVLAYGNPALKAGVDIDVLIDPAQLGVAAAILRQLGYVRADGRDSASLAGWHRVKKDSEWTRAGGGPNLDLHTRLTDSPRLLPAITVRSPCQLVDLGGGIALPALAIDEMFAHLAVHGASSAWFRLKWISDFAALIAPLPAPEIDRLYRRSQQLGAGRAAGQALLLADQLFGSLIALPALRTELSSDWRTRLLVRAALNQLVLGKEPTGRRGGTWRIHWTQLLIQPGPAFKIAELARQLRAALVART